MTIEGAISYYEGQAVYAKYHGYPLAEEWNGQITAWLRELQERRKAPEIIRCKDCNWNDGTCYCNFHYRNVKANDHCSWAERRTDEQHG